MKNINFRGNLHKLNEKIGNWKHFYVVPEWLWQWKQRTTIFLWRPRDAVLIQLKDTIGRFR